MDHEQPRQELVKCVVVGDTAVGKTRLICARACNKQFSLTQLLNTHVPTVFAIDQYRIYKDVLERSWVMVDGVNVSLRLWDTFGDHDKDRRFAYGRSDVVLLCFSVSSAISLRNCRAVWYPEIRKFCPNTPILLVGCKNDLRHICNDDQYISYCKDRSPLVRPTRECDLIMPGEGRVLARELGADYYETSVLSFYGVREVFDNVVRSALISRKQQRFWMTNLKRVQRPIPQVPYCPPKPKLAEANVCPSSIPEDLHLLYHSGELTDLVLVAGSTVLCAHRFILAAASTAFHKLFANELTDSAGQRRCSDSSMQSGTFGDSTAGGFNSDTECLLSLSDHTSASSKASTRLREALKRRSSMQSLPFDQRQVSHRELSHPAFHSISLEQWYEKSSCAAVTQFKEGSTWPSNLTSTQTVVALNVDGAALRHAIHFAYTGTILCRKCQLPLPDLGQLREVAQLLELGELNEFLAQLLKRDEFNSGNDAQAYLQVLQCRLRDLCVESLCCDVLFQLEDGVAPAHRALLMSRCDMMHAMFASGFRESNARVVSFPDIKLRTFQILLQYLYKDMVPTLKIHECLPTVELANRLCLPRLISLVESEIIDLFNRVIQAGGDVSEDCLCLLEPLQVYNADQLADWCLSYIASNYNNVCYKYAKLIRALHPENQAWLNRHRWPPVWYLKDFDFYERCLIERQREAKPIKPPKTSSGCLCFATSFGRKEDKAIEYHTIPQHSFSLSY